MASIVKYTASELLDILDEDSDEDFDGYIEDMDIDMNSDDNSNDLDGEVNGGGSNAIASSIPPFIGPSGSTSDMSNKHPVEFFQILLTDSILEGIVEQTELFATQFLHNTNLPPRSVHTIG